MRLEFRGLTEDRPGAAWRAVHEHGWPGWRAWFLRKGGRAGPSLRASRKALRDHMPEMVPVWERLVEVGGGDADLACFLTFWTPPRYLVHCSQAVTADDEGPLLIRNYDLDPRLNEATVLRSAWRGRRVMGMVEGLAGLADGMNDAGLAASLTFGGRTESGAGFGVPLILRYVLEVADDVRDAVEVLRAVPCHMAYNVAVADRGGAFATVFLAPGRPAVVTDRPAATNHQPGFAVSARGRATRTLERERLLEGLLASGADLAPAFLRAPLFSTDYRGGFGTVYTAAYRPAAGEVTLAWREGPPLAFRLDAFEPAERAVIYAATGSRALAPAAAQRPAAPAAAEAPDWLGAFFGELAGCLSGARDWSRMGAFFEERRVETGAG